MLDWTGNPLVDVGLAAICALTDKSSPAEINLEDLDRAADEMREYYFSGGLTSYLSCVFMNSEYVQPGEGAKKQESRKKYAERVLYAHRQSLEAEAQGLTCAFSGKPATHLIHRGQMPMITGEGVLNFFPASTGALAISGPYLTALQAVPLGGRRCEGKMLVAHSDDPTLTLELARLYVEDNRRLMQLVKAGGLPAKDGPDPALDREQGSWDATNKRAKYPDAKVPSSLIISDLIEISQTRGFSAEVHAGLTVYWLTSSGQGPSLAYYNLPSNLLTFVRKASMAPTHARWMNVVTGGWQSLESKGGKSADKKSRRKDTVSLSAPSGPGRSRNVVLSDLFAIYEDGFANRDAIRRFVRRHLLTYLGGRIRRSVDCDWALTELFLKEVLGMQQERIEAIRTFADRLAEHIRQRNDRPFFRDLVYLDRAYEFRNALTKAQRNEARANGGLLFGMDDYLKVFEADDAVGRSEWALIRDLISIRVVEQLQKAGWLTKEILGDDESGQTAA
jgi:CRISPR-associated protein Cst1